MFTTWRSKERNGSRCPNSGLVIIGAAAHFPERLALCPQGRMLDDREIEESARRIASATQWEANLAR
jgi:hypothetical protein